MAHPLTGPAAYAGYPPQVPPHRYHPTPGADWRRPGIPAPAPGPWASYQPTAFHGQFPPAAQPWPAPNPMRLGRRGVAVIAAGAVAGLAVTVATVVALTSGHGDTQLSASGGVHVPAPPVKTAPAPQHDAPSSPAGSTALIADTDLPGLLPPEEHVSQVVGAVELIPIDKMNGPGTFQDDANPAQCVGAVLSASKLAYAGSGVHGTYVQALHERDKGPIHSVFNAVSTFDSAAQASSFVTQQSGVWQGCQAGPVVLDPNDSKPMTWNVRDVARHGDVLTAQIKTDGAAATCQRALTARRNVVIDVTTCSRDITDTAATLATQIAEHMGASA